MKVQRSVFWSFAVSATLGLCVPACGDKTSTAPPLSAGPRFDFSFAGVGTSHAFTFTQAGDWEYRCKTHEFQGMKGKIFVRASSLNTTASVTVGPGGTRVFSPDTLTIGLNGVVTWANPTTEPSHTVTRP
jgi:plastocyanin